MHNIFKFITIPASVTEWTKPKDEHYVLRIHRNDVVLRYIVVWFASGNQNYTQVQIKKNDHQFLPSPFSQATGKDSTGGDFFSGEDVVYPPFILNDELEKGQYFDIFYKNSDASEHSMAVTYVIEDIVPVILKAKKEAREKKLLQRVNTGILNTLRRAFGKSEITVEEEPAEVEPQPEEPLHDAYYEYDELNEPDWV